METIADDKALDLDAWLDATDYQWLVFYVQKTVDIRNTVILVGT